MSQLTCEKDVFFLGAGFDVPSARRLFIYISVQISSIALHHPLPQPPPQLLPRLRTHFLNIYI